MQKINKLYNLPKLRSLGITGKNINIAILDSGIFPHPDLTNNIIFFKDCVNNQEKYYDDNSHGSHISGIICGNGSLRSELVGIAPDSNIIPIKVLNEKGTGKQDDIINAIQWIIRNKDLYNIKIVNISLGTPIYSCDEENSLLVKSVESLWNLGLTVIVSAGNNGPKYGSITTPGVSPKVITVGTLKSRFSGKGPTPCKNLKPDIIAPGDNILSCGNFNGYTIKSGTSMSTAIVSGVAALIFSITPGITNQEFKQLLCTSSTDLGVNRYVQGCGYLNLKRMLKLS